jgi:hypothetical protein
VRSPGTAGGLALAGRSLGEAMASAEGSKVVDVEAEDQAGRDRRRRPQVAVEPGLVKPGARILRHYEGVAHSPGGSGEDFELRRAPGVRPGRDYSARALSRCVRSGYQPGAAACRR